MVRHTAKVIFRIRPCFDKCLVNILQNFVRRFGFPVRFSCGSVFYCCHSHLFVINNPGCTELLKAEIYVLVNGLVVVQADSFIEHIFKISSDLFQFCLVNKGDLHSVHPCKYLEQIFTGINLHGRNRGRSAANDRVSIGPGRSIVHIKGGGKFYPSAPGLGYNITLPGYGA